MALGSGVQVPGITGTVLDDYFQMFKPDIYSYYSIIPVQPRLI